MTLAQHIQKWLNEEGSYIEGVGLLLRAGIDTTYYNQFFALDYVPTHIEQRLENALTAYLETCPDEPELALLVPVVSRPVSVRETTGTEQPQQLAVQATPLNTEPPEITTLRQKARQLHKQQSATHTELRLTALSGDHKQAYELADSIMRDLTPALDEIYDRIRAWEADGTLPPIAAVDDGFKRAIELMKKKETLKSRVSRLKGFLKKNQTPTDRQRYEAELLEKELELERVLALLDVG